VSTQQSDASKRATRSFLAARRFKVRTASSTFELWSLVPLLLTLLTSCVDGRADGAVCLTVICANGSNGPGATGTGSNGTGSNGTGSNGTGANGAGANGTGANGAGANGAGGNGALSGPGSGAIVPGTGMGAPPGGGPTDEVIVPPDAKPTPESSGTPGIFRVNAAGRVTQNGVTLQVRGGNWFGLEGQDDLARPGAMELYIGAVSWASSADKRSIATTMAEIRTSGLKLNTIRLPVAPQTLVPGHPDGDYSRTDVKIRNNDATFYSYASAYDALEDFIIQANENNLYLILDLHSCSNHIGWRAGRIDDGPPWVDATRDNYDYKKENYTCKSGEDAYDKAKWLADIRTLAKLPKKLGVSNVLGIDCFNEPFKYSWGQWSDLAKECYDAIAAENDDLIAVVEGVSGSHVDDAGKAFTEPFGSAEINPNWGENLFGQRNDPIQIPKDRLCFSPHTYGPSVYVQKQFIDQTNPACVGLEDDAAGKAKCKLTVTKDNPQTVALLRKGWDEHFGYLADQHYCLIIGEFGGYKDWPANPVKPSAATVWAHLPAGVRYDFEWQSIFVDYLRDKKIDDFTYWAINPESGDTGGVYQHAYTTSNKSGWGVWRGLDTDKVQLLSTLTP